MTYRVRIAPAAVSDLRRLVLFLAVRNPKAASRAEAALRRAVASLKSAPNRGRPAPHEGFRELFVKFGRRGFAVRYRVTEDLVLVTRIHHSLEDRLSDQFD